MRIVGVCLAAMLLSTVAAATEFDDKATGFHMSLDLPGALVCVIQPASLQNAVACKGIDVAKATSPDNKSLITAIVRKPGAWGAMLVVTAQKFAHSGPATKHDAEEAAAGAFESMQADVNPKAQFKELRPGVRIDTQVIQGVQAFTFLFGAPPTPESAFDAYLESMVIGREHLVTLLWETGTPKLPQVQAAADALLKTVRMPPSTGSPAWK